MSTASGTVHTLCRRVDRRPNRPAHGLSIARSRAAVCDSDHAIRGEPRLPWGIARAGPAVNDALSTYAGRTRPSRMPTATASSLEWTSSLPRIDWMWLRTVVTVMPNRLAMSSL